MKIPKFKTLPMFDNIILPLKVSIIVVFCLILIAAISIPITRMYETMTSAGDDFDTKRQRALDIIEEARQEISKMQRLEAENAVEAEFLQEDITELRKELIQISQESKWMADCIANNQPFTLSDGTILNVSELKKYAQHQLQQSKILESRLTAMNNTLTLYLENAEAAHQRWKMIDQQVALLELQLEALDAHAESLRIYEQQPASAIKNQNIDNDLAEAQELLRYLEKTLRKDVMVHEIKATMEQDSGYVEIEDAVSTSALIDQLRSLSNSIHRW